MRERHKGNFTEAQLPLLAERNGRSIGPVFNSCPLCGAEDVMGRLEDHIVGHLRFLALKSLPRIDDGEDEYSEEMVRSSGSTKPPSRSTIKDFDRNVRQTFDGDDYPSSPTPDGDGQNVADLYAPRGGYANYIATYYAGFMQQQANTGQFGEPHQLFQPPSIPDGDDYPTSWPEGHSVRFVDGSLFAGFPPADLRQFEWSFVLDIVQPYEGPKSDSILRSFLRQTEVHQEDPEILRKKYLSDLKEKIRVPSESDVDLHLDGAGYQLMFKSKLLIFILQRHRKYEEAEEMEKPLSERCKQMLKKEYPGTLMRMADLKSMYWNQGERMKAEELETEMQELVTQVANQALTFQNQGRWEEAKELFVHIIDMSARVLGTEHPGALTSMSSMALAFRNQG